MPKHKCGLYIRSILDLGDFNDDEVNNEPSMTDPSQDITIDDLVKKMLRGEPVAGSSVSYDTEITNAEGLTTAFQSVPVQNTSGFDIADVAPILDKVSATIAELDKNAPEPVAPPVPPAPEAPPEAKPN